MINSDTRLQIITGLNNWYKDNARDLPWRRTSDPYAIWVSEIMLQQTRVETVIPYYQRWMSDLPTLQALVLAGQDQVLKLWEGLGYYSRARNLHKAATVIMEDFDGKLPEDIESLKSLPGIGRYTAGAILSIAFNQRAPILDGNIKRVFSRLFDIATPIKTSETEKELWQIAEDLLPTDNPGDFNQALMELGALVCHPKNPDCDRCPLQRICLAFEFDLQDDRPVQKLRSSIPHLQVTAAVIKKDGKVLLAKRPLEGLLGGMWEFPGGKQEKGETLPQALEREIKEELDACIKVEDHLGTYKHAYTHYKVTLHAFRCHLVSDQLRLIYHTELAWVTPDSMETYPMGKLDRTIAEQLSADPDQS